MDTTQLSIKFQRLGGLAVVTDDTPPAEPDGERWLRAIRVHNLGPEHCLMMGTFMHIGVDGDIQRHYVGDLEHVLAPGESRLLISTEILNEKLGKVSEDERQAVNDTYENAQFVQLESQFLAATYGVRLVADLSSHLDFGDGHSAGRIRFKLQKTIELGELRSLA